MYRSHLSTGSSFSTRVAGHALYAQNGRCHIDPNIEYESFECAYRILLDGEELHRGVIGWNSGKRLEAAAFHLHGPQPPYGTEFIMKTYNRYGGLVGTHRLVLQAPESTV